MIDARVCARALRAWLGHALVAVCLFACASGCSAELDLPEPQPPASADDYAIASDASDAMTNGLMPASAVDDAETLLMRTEMFSYGFATDRTRAYNLLMAQSDRLDRFRRISARGAWGGQLYAFCAFEALAAPESDAVADRLAFVRESVLLYERDVAQAWSVAYIARHIRSKQVWRELRRSGG